MLRIFQALLLLVTASLFIPSTAVAGQLCPPTMNDAVINFQNYSITDYPTLPPGSMLSGAILGQENRSFYNCPTGTGPVVMRFVANKLLHVAGVSGVTPNGVGSPASVYEIPDIPGVGFAVGVRETTHCAGNPVHYIASGDEDVAVCSTDDPVQMATQFFVVFYKTAQEVAYDRPNSGQINAGTLILQDSNGNIISAAGVTVNVAAADLKVHRASCYVSDNDITVAMGQTSVSDLNNGAEGAKHHFTIPLTCESSQNNAVKMGFYGPSEKDAVNHDVLTLSQQEGAATGVGIRITYGDNYGAVAGNTVPLNSTNVQPFPDSASQAQLNLQYDAQYVKTGARATAGQADSLATFSLIYN
ncbi:hypothetical protein EHN07_06995 [Buttiauxella warmboldiae]|uniref:Fimbrial-type adhesion domain-containing protein n=1 Tax=Buttiauxella warmboldiae TaxID=82993 RepID=A0A3N5DN83_9ENTR|nr:fimbrial protein [Buttiauxella warmboldiae]RPH29087.1 hypothetical protein EHN07_06995 [Buttiauxella warmboldiae]